MKRFINDKHFRELKSAVERQRYVQKTLGINRKAVNGLGRPMLEMDPYLAMTIQHIAADADGTVHGDALTDPTMLRLLKRDGIEVGVKDCGTTTARVGFRQTVDYSYQQPAEGGQRREESGGRIRFRKTYATA